MIKFNAIKAATLVANNESDAERVYNISAEVETRNGKATNVQSGTVKVLEGEQNISTFSGWNENQLNVTMDGVPEEEKDAVFKAVRLFVKELRTKASEFDLSALL
jgi:hypothetical protein